MPIIRVSAGRLAPLAPLARPGQWRVRSGLLAPYHVVDPVSKLLLPTSVRRALLLEAMRRRRLAPAHVVRHLNAVRNYLRNKTSERAAAIRRAYTRDILFAQAMRV